MLSKSFIESAYRTRGNELCKYVRAEVMEQIESSEAVTKCTKEQFNAIVKNTMERINTIILPMIEVEVERL